MKFEALLLQKMKQGKKWGVLFLILGVLALCLQMSKNNSVPTTPPSVERMESVDTYIPKGYVLVPLNLMNVESLNSFIGDKGVVDLYTAKEGRQGKKIADKIKLIRAPLNPEVYAALVSESQSQKLVLDGESYYAVVQNKNSESGQVDLAKPTRSDFKIYYSKEVKN